ncbi:response regulator [Geomonas subterranea]|uniref:Response regulator n=1 Tax=Geomonas subterranea TaxID=2847989 RepID=A0ABX8LF49_9BACT|nr:response regulator [Geomonas subterranea]QXE89275.1 response regulator [Geomonas subterranea]QXM08613.1 response regulator [Geomonas subterranea]
MSLVGNLEDLGLGEILQIVSLSRRSGVLALESRGREARVIFRNGQVIRATSSTFQQNLGEVLIQQGVIDLGILKRALSIQADEGYSQLLGVIMVERFAVSADAIEAVVREQIENVVYSLFAWAEGTFEFELQEIGDGDNARLDPVQFMLKQGLNPQYLAMEGSRIIDEQRHRGEGGDEAGHQDESVDFAFDLLQEPSAAAPATPPHTYDVPSSSAQAESVLSPTRAPAPAPAAPVNSGQGTPLVLVDDDPITLVALTSLLSEHGYQVEAMERGEDALIRVDSLYRDGVRPAVLVDLIMPRMDGSGILGGLELMELVRNNFPELPLLGLSDFENEEAQRKMRGLGIRLLMKPLKSEIEDSLDLFAPKLVAALESMAIGDEAGLTSVNIGDELRLEMGEEPALSAPHVNQSTGISQLRGMLEELNNPQLGGGIILLVLRFAAEFMNRAVVLLVKKESVQGLGQFGLQDKDGRADSRVRNLIIPRGEPSLFTQVLENRFTVKEAPDASVWTHYFMEQLGGGRPAEYFVGPIVSEGKVVAILYGDNLPEDKPIGDTDSLEIFLCQAGIAMEKALLQRRLQEQGRGEM